jgi:hypothetical protein
MTAAAYLIAIGALLRLEGIALTRLDRDDPRHPLARNRRARALIATASGWGCAIVAVPLALAALVSE